MKRATYVIGTTIAFALLGLWAGRLLGSNEGWVALLGASVGLLLGSAFAPGAARKRSE